jgi:hypothetical protein
LHGFRHYAVLYVGVYFQYNVIVYNALHVLLIFRYKNLPYGKALSGDHLKRDLEQLAQTYFDRVDRLVNLGSTQANESFNNTVASFAPKNR